MYRNRKGFLRVDNSATGRITLRTGKHDNPQDNHLRMAAAMRVAEECTRCMAESWVSVRFRLNPSADGAGAPANVTEKATLRDSIRIADTEMLP